MKYEKINLTEYEILQIELEINLIQSQLNKFEETNSMVENGEVVLKMFDRLYYLIDLMEASVYWNKRK